MSSRDSGAYRAGGLVAVLLSFLTYLDLKRCQIFSGVHSTSKLSYLTKYQHDDQFHHSSATH